MHSCCPDLTIASVTRTYTLEKLSPPKPPLATLLTLYNRRSDMATTLTMRQNLQQKVVTIQRSNSSNSEQATFLHTKTPCDQHSMMPFELGSETKLLRALFPSARSLVVLMQMLV